MTNVLTNPFLTKPMVQLQTPHRTDTSQTPRNPVKCADVFSFDDMLASCVAEITKNGMDTLAVPDTIKDWVAGKLLRAFPKQLTQRLLNFMMEQRDFEGLLAFRECRTGDVPEFTLLLHRDHRSRASNPDGLQNDQSQHNNLPKIFDDAKITNNGEKFFCNELLIDETSIVPIKYPQTWRKKTKLDDMPPVDPSSVKTIYKNETINKEKLTPYDLDESFRDNLIHEASDSEDSDEREFNAKNNAKFSLSIKKKRNLTGKKLGRPAKQEDGKELDYQCHVCDSAFHSNSNLAKHYKYKHPNVVNPHTASFYKLQTEARMLKDFPEIYHDPDSGYVCTICGHNTPRLFRCARHVTEVHRKDKGFNCEICQKSFSRGSSLKRHMMLHSGNLFPCQYCGKAFGQLWDLDNIHKRSHHPEEYAKEQADKQKARDLKAKGRAFKDIEKQMKAMGQEVDEGMIRQHVDSMVHPQEGEDGLPSLRLGGAGSPKYSMR